MSKIERLWHGITFWNKLRATLIGIGVLVEAQLLRQEAHWLWHSASFVIGVIVLIITNWFEDKDNNGKVDFLERKKKTK